MRANLSYPARASFHLDEHWPIDVDGVTFSLEIEEGRLAWIVAEWQLEAGDNPPEIMPLEEGRKGVGRVRFELASRARVDHLLRTIQGLLSVHGAIEVDFDRPTLRWVAESEDEELGIEIVLRADPPKADPFKPERLEFGAIARTIAAAPAAAPYEVALSFLRRGTRDLKEGRFIESFYNNFFFLETQFAGGLSNPQKVKARLKAEPRIAAALALARSHPLDPPRGFTTTHELALWDERLAYLGRDDAAIIDDLVGLRGRLHHHSMRHSEAWHPDKATGFRVAAYSLRDIAFGVADGLFAETVWSTDHDELLARAAERAGAVTVLRVEIMGIFPSRGATRLSFDLRSPGKIITRGMIEAADLELRRRLKQVIGGPMMVNGYSITDVADGRHYARYERITPTP